jgi:membrane protein
MSPSSRRDDEPRLARPGGSAADILPRGRVREREGMTARLAHVRPIKWIVRFVERLTEHQTGELATIIAFNIIYAMFPLALALTGLGGFIFHGEAARAQLLHEVRAAFPPQVAKEISDVINTAESRAGLIGAVGFASLLWAGSNLFTAIEVSFARIFGVRPRGIVHQRLVAFAMILTFFALLVLSVAASNIAVIVVPPHEPPPAPLPEWGIQRVLGLFGGWVILVAMHLVIYLVIPNVRLPFRALWPGALLAGTSLQVITQAFPLYIRYLAGFNRFGDAFSLVFLVMTWSYLLAFILLVGAEINALRVAPQVTTPAGENAP